MQSLVAALVIIATSVLAQPGIVGTANVNVFQGTCATQSGSDVQVNQATITPVAANICDDGSANGFIINNQFVVNCASTSTVGAVQLYPGGSNCIGSPLATNCADGTGDATGFYHVFTCVTAAPTSSPTAPTSKAPTAAPTGQPTTAAPTQLPTTLAPTQLPTIAPTLAPTAAPTVAPTKAPTTLAPTSSVTKTPTSGNTGMPTTAPTPTAFLQCAPQKGIKKNACNKKIKTCDAMGIDMKWTGTGCSAGGEKLNDGGCQCSGYCGFQCKVACNGDKSGECIWDDVDKQCLVKATGQPGEPIPFCKP